MQWQLAQALEKSGLTVPLQNYPCLLPPADGSIHIASGNSSGDLAVRHKRQLAAAYQSSAASDSYFVQLPAQSYAEHQGCGFWQSLVETLQHHPRRWAACGATLALLLLIVLCATLIPAAQRRRQRPQFLAPPAVAGTGASWIDLSVQLNRPALLSWMAFRQADLNQAVPGMGGRTLLELIQEEGVQAEAVYAASSAAASLDPGASPQPGLQQLAVACGWAPVGNSTVSSKGPAAARVSLLSASGASAAACAAASAAASSPGRCARCPRLDDSTPYTLLLVAASAGSGAVGSAVHVLNALTGDASVNVNSLDPPYADNATAASFDLHFKLNSPSGLGWVGGWVCRGLAAAGALGCCAEKRGRSRLQPGACDWAECAPPLPPAPTPCPASPCRHAALRRCL